MPTKVRETIIKLVLFSFAIGVILHFFDIDPQSLLARFGDTVEKIFSVVASFIEWAVKYVLLGAVVVVPIWLLFFLFEKMRGK